MKVIKHWQVKRKKGVAVPFLRSLYDMRAEINQVIKLLAGNLEIDIKPQLADWCDKLNPLTIKDSIKEIQYASQERLQITRGKDTKSRKVKKEKKKVTK